mmetsp:Transcript_50798/g.99576  ORF Transcript_50798/g.99576 Transcript_50798/m.99576 type:complete len:348 (-) Transcript_50798:170-1213(-)
MLYLLLSVVGVFSQTGGWNWGGPNGAANAPNNLQTQKYPENPPYGPQTGYSVSGGFYNGYTGAAVGNCCCAQGYIDPNHPSANTNSQSQQAVQGGGGYYNIHLNKGSNPTAQWNQGYYSGGWGYNFNSNVQNTQQQPQTSQSSQNCWCGTYWGYRMSTEEQGQCGSRTSGGYAVRVTQETAVNPVAIPTYVEPVATTKDQPVAIDRLVEPPASPILVAPPASSILTAPPVAPVYTTYNVAPSYNSYAFNSAYNYNSYYPAASASAYTYNSFPTSSWLATPSSGFSSTLTSSTSPATRNIFSNLNSMASVNTLNAQTSLPYSYPSTSYNSYTPYSSYFSGSFNGINWG